MAPLLFIISVDLLYDEFENNNALAGIDLSNSKGKMQEKLKVAGFADDTAIYIADRGMQKEAIRAVGCFSDVSGLRLNVVKSTAIALGSNKHVE
ncbi:hypothetical protein V7S43_010499 [Phytophthora oleae]|uniref:Reverse transcriptase domain-containing protein n=1 Tax=Phytophthora oleae TaxID=2107226 RepID=A0ABD3FEC5_9STRA